MSSKRSSGNFGGSGKKPSSPGGVPVSWSTCPTCSLRFPNRNLLQKHVDLGCRDVFPFVNAQHHGVFELTHGPERFGKNLQQCKVFLFPVPPKLKLKVRVRGLQEFSSYRISYALGGTDRDILFLHYALLAEMGLKTLDWVSVSKLSRGGGGGGEEDPFVPIAMRVVGSAGGGSSYKALLNSNAASIHATLVPGEDIISIQLIDQHVPLAVRVTLIVLPSQHAPSGAAAEGIKEKLQSWLDGRLICPNSTFRLPFLTYIITVKVKVVLVHGQEEFQQGFYRVIKETEIVVEMAGGGDEMEDREQEDKVTLDSVGGLEDEIRDLRASIAYACTADNKRHAARGFLLYGEHGTGKTLLMNAICTSLSFVPIPLEEYGKKGLRKAFHEAVRMGRAAAVLIENVDSLSSAHRDGEEMVKSRVFLIQFNNFLI